MSANPERVRWEWAAREMAATGGPPLQPVPAKAQRAAAWRVVSADGSRRAASRAAAKTRSAAEILASELEGPSLARASGAPGKKPIASPAPSVAMPVALPTLSGDSVASEPLPENLALEAIDAGPCRQPGVDGRRAGAPAAIDAPAVKARPSISVAAVGAALQAGRAGSGSVAMSRGKLDPQLSRVMDAWPALAGRTREAILAMIDVSLGRK